ncbi:MAG: ClbS/DfsB family four-helix bundle protein [Thermomicrobiales bacterium]|nr:ClbS/DfsB family four-helix bundle protein [Thermomicrobiales bacterium]
MDDAPAKTPPATTADLLQRIHSSWETFITSLDGLADELLLEPGAVGEWSLKNLFGHIALWDDLGRENVALALAGNPRSFDDYQELNDADHEARLHRTLDEERAAMQQSHAALVAELEAHDNTGVTAIDAAIEGSTYGHYAEHLPDVRAWRERHRA